MERAAARDLLIRAWRAGVGAADPRQATRDAVLRLVDPASNIWIIAIGKGGHSMADGAFEALAIRRMTCPGGIVVAQETPHTARHGLESANGDHPVPHEGSFRAAERLGQVVDKVPPDADALVLISGGATSLAAGPVTGVDPNDLTLLFERLLGSGADIQLMNTVRKRVLRWGAGRLATALHSRTIRCLIASDVAGNDPACIASGPCTPDPLTAREVMQRVDAAGLRATLPPSVVRYLDDVRTGKSPETPDPSHPRWTSTFTEIILDRHYAVRGAAQALSIEGVSPIIIDDALTGDAATAGMSIANQALTLARDEPSRRCLVFSGENTVTVGADSGKGGRCQELALSAAKALARAGDHARGITLLAAGTDGRDGPTDAAGALVDNQTWHSIATAGLDPERALARHDAWTALDAAGALLRSGPTGTNVNDLVLALIES